MLIFYVFKKPKRNIWTKLHVNSYGDKVIWLGTDGELVVDNAGVDSQHVRWLPSEQVCVPVQDVSDAFVLMASEVPTELRALPGFGSELLLE